MKGIQINDEVYLRNYGREVKEETELKPNEKTMKVIDISYSTDKILCSWVDEHTQKICTGLFKAHSLHKVKKNVIIKKPLHFKPS